jgi:hypothetical protein
MYFRELIELYGETYQKAARKMKASIRVEIEELIYNQTPPGRFLQPVGDQQDDDGGSIAVGTTSTALFQIASDACINLKIEQALNRHGHHGGATKTTTAITTLTNMKQAPLPSKYNSAKNKNVTTISQQKEQLLPDRKIQTWSEFLL